MKASRTFSGIALAILSLGTACAQSYVTTFGDLGWYSDDTRDGSISGANGANELLGLEYTHPSYGVGTAGADLGIAERIAWETPVFGSANGLGALRLSTLTPSSGKLSSGKATLSLVNASEGFAAASTLTSSSFYGSLTYYNPADKQLAMRINIQSTAWTGAQPTNILGENTWDLTLVYVGSGTGAWTTDTVNATTGLWTVYKAGNSSITGSLPKNKTLQQLADDPTWGSILFGAGAVISNVQLGVGSSSTNTTGYASSLQLSFLNGGRPYEFIDSANLTEVTTVEPVYTGSTSKVYQVTGTSGQTGETVSVANTGTTGEATTFSLQKDSKLVTDQITVEGGGILTGSGIIEGNVTIENGGVLSGANSVTGETRVTNGATHRPGFSPAAVTNEGTYILENGTLQIEIGGMAEATGEFDAPVTGDFDQLFYSVGADLSFSTIEIAQWNGYTPVWGDTFNILYAPTITIGDELLVVGVGAFAGLEFELTVVSDVDFGSGTYQALQAQVVPEPSTLGLAALASAMALLVFRRQARQKS